MTDYTKLDAAIIAAIKAGRSPIYNNNVNGLAATVATSSKRDQFRVIDGRLQALRKAGVIAYLTKAKSPTGQAGWAIGEKGEAR